ncbi:MAG: glyoxalase/bleomycin resistance/extradiol dioxygenase family protein [Bacteroidota bacterium]|nr:glyoxalase/bleomycin resistance/extradiol dioxygenase family protein [Bacteroidota bacterium]
MIHLSPYLSFKGNSRAVLAFYQSCLGGELDLMRFGDSPAAANMPPETHDQIMHGTLTTQDFIIMASDAGGMGRPLHEGNNVKMSLHFDNDAEIDAAFARLGEGGTIVDPLADMPWGGKYGALTDQFGINWLFNFQRPAGS